MTKKTALEIAAGMEILYERATKKYEVALNKRTRGESQTRYKAHIAKIGRLMLLSPTDQKRYSTLYERYIRVSAEEDKETQRLQKKLTRLMK